MGTRDSVLRLLTQAWLVYAGEYYDSDNYERVLQAICNAQLLVFQEEDGGD